MEEEIWGYGISSTSYIESLWHSLKSKILSTYKHIPDKYFISYLKEAEYKVKNNDKIGFEIIKEFFECFYHKENLSDIIVEKDEEYLSDEDFNKGESDSD